MTYYHNRISYLHPETRKKAPQRCFRAFTHASIVFDFLMATSKEQPTSGRGEAPATTAAVERFRGRAQQGAANTRRAYAADLRSFEAYCAAHGFEPYPASVDALSHYVAHLAELPRKLATIRRHLASIQRQHKLKGLKSGAGTPELLDVMQGIALDLGTEQKQAPAFSVDHLKSCIQKLDLTTPSGLRDRALLLLGFTGAFRRSELVAIDLEHLILGPEELIIRLGRTKTNQTGAAQEKAFFYAENTLYCPIRACQDWVGQLGGRTTGPLFVSIARGRAGSRGTPTLQRLSTNSVNTLVGRHLGCDSTGQRYTAHSFRSSFITTAKLAGQSNDFIKNQTKQKTDAILSRYTRLTDVKAYNAGRALGL